MKTSRKWLSFGALLAVLVGLIGVGPLAGIRVAQAAPATATTNAVLPATTCTLTAPGQRTCDLWATAGTIMLPGPTAVPIWGYTDQMTGTAQLPGPVLIANQGEALTVVLHNTLAETTSLVFPGQDLVPDLVGVAPGGSVSYTFLAANPGTFFYEAGLTPYGPRQVAMGLFGVLIVRPAGQPNWAYNDPATAFDDEALLVINEIDPAFNADPVNFSMLDYSPKFWLINGVAYPDTAPIATMPGHNVLLRQLNGGIIHRSVGLMGLHQTILANDGNPLAYPYQVVAKTIPAGATMDTLATIPANAPAGAQYAFYETGQHVRNAGQQLVPGGPLSFGGILTFLNVPTGTVGPDLWGPLVSGALVAPNPSAGTMGVTLTATISDQSTGGATVTGGEYFTDTLGAPGTGVPFSIPTPTITVSAAVHISPAALSALLTGEHIYYLRGRDDLGNWGPVGSAAFELVTVGPVVTGMVLTPATGNGTQDMDIQATGDARPSGPADVVQAEYFIDVPGGDGSGTPMALNRIEPVASMTATVFSPTVAALSEGPHVIYIHALDSLGNWGGFGRLEMRVDKTGPGASHVTIMPNPNNGYLGLLPTLPVVRLRATFGDPVMGGINSILSRAEGFIDTIGPDGTGFELGAVDGAFHLPVEEGYLFIQLFSIRQLSAGPHTFYVHAQDIAGNWGPVNSVVLVVDKTGPDTVGLILTPNPTNGATGVSISAGATDPVNPGAPPSNIVAGEWFVGTDPGPGLGTPLAAADGAFNQPTERLVGSINVSRWAQGSYIISVRAKDAASNWGPVTTATLFVTRRTGPGPRPFIFADGFETGNFAAWTQSTGPVTVTSAAAILGNFGMATTLDSAVNGYVANGTLGIEEDADHEAIYSVRFRFDPNGADTAGSQHAIFAAEDVSGTTIFAIEYRHIQSGPNAYEARAWALDEDVRRFTAWYPLRDGPNVIEIGWESSPTATVSFYVNYDLVESLDEVETYHYLVDQARLGAPEGVTPGMHGTEYVDQFLSSSAIRVPFIVNLPLVARY
jgi:hypothetical protein